MKEQKKTWRQLWFGATFGLLLALASYFGIPYAVGEIHFIVYFLYFFVIIGSIMAIIPFATLALQKNKQ